MRGGNFIDWLSLTLGMASISISLHSPLIFIGYLTAIGVWLLIKEAAKDFKS